MCYRSLLPPSAFVGSVFRQPVHSLSGGSTGPPPVQYLPLHLHVHVLHRVVIDLQGSDIQTSVEQGSSTKCWKLGGYFRAKSAFFLISRGFVFLSMANLRFFTRSASLGISSSFSFIGDSRHAQLPRVLCDDSESKLHPLGSISELLSTFVNASCIGLLNARSFWIFSFLREV